MSKKLAKEINDEFLVCKICLDHFKNPKCLDCLHTFCEACIDNHVLSECTYKKYSDYREFTCPLCRKRTTLPVGGVKKLPDNFLVSSLGEVVGRQVSSTFQFCEICKHTSHRRREAAMKCIDCAKLLCSECVNTHAETKVTAHHSLFDLGTEKDILCKEHEGEVVRFYCEPCENCICVLCTFNEHKDHEILSFGDAVDKYKAMLDTTLEKSHSKLEQFKKHNSILSDCNQQIKLAEQKIEEVAAHFIAEINQSQKNLTEELYKMFGTNVTSQLNKGDEYKQMLEDLENTCKLAGHMLKGQDVELLLVRKQIQDKLENSSGLAITEISKGAVKNIRFVPGSITLGHLEDSDNPSISKRKPVTMPEPKAKPVKRRSLQTQTGSSLRTLGTQTDAVVSRPPLPAGRVADGSQQNGSAAVNIVQPQQIQLEAAPPERRLRRQQQTTAQPTTGRTGGGFTILYEPDMEPPAYSQSSGDGPKRMLPRSLSDDNTQEIWSNGLAGAKSALKASAAASKPDVTDGVKASAKQLKKSLTEGEELEQKSKPTDSGVRGSSDFIDPEEAAAAAELAEQRRNARRQRRERADGRTRRTQTTVEAPTGRRTSRR